MILSITNDKPGVAEALTEPSTSIKVISLRPGEKKKSQAYPIRQHGKRQEMAQIWQNMAACPWLRDTRKLHNPRSHQERGCASSISSGQETGLIAKLKITESLSVHPSLDVSRLNKYGHTGLQVKWKDVKCPRLQAWGGFAPLKSICLNFTSSLVSLIWDHHRSAIFSFGQMHMVHFQKCFFVLENRHTASFHGTCSSQRSHTTLETTQTNRLRAV